MLTDQKIPTGKVSRCGRLKLFSKSKSRQLFYSMKMEIVLYAVTYFVKAPHDHYSNSLREFMPLRIMALPTFTNLYTTVTQISQIKT